MISRSVDGIDYYEVSNSSMILNILPNGIINSFSVIVKFPSQKYYSNKSIGYNSAVYQTVKSI